MRRVRSDYGIRMPTMYGYETLEVGESMLIEPLPGVPRETHVARVKKSVYWQNSFRAKRWTCATKTTGVRVTRTK